MKVQGICAAWFRREDWPKWMALDPDVQPDFAKWLAKMEKAVANYQKAGIPIIKVVIDPDEFEAWAKQNGRGFGTNDRAAFAGIKGAQTEKAKR